MTPASVGRPILALRQIAGERLEEAPPSLDYDQTSQSERARSCSPTDSECGQASLTPFPHLSPAAAPCAPLWQPADAVLSNPQVQVDYFTQKICKVLTAFDSKYNQFRTVGVSRTRESLLFFSLCRYMTAAFLGSSGGCTRSALVVEDAQTELLHRLQTEVAQLDISKQAKTEDVLTAVIMFGLSTNWDGSNAPSIFHYNAAVRLYRHTFQTNKPNTRQGDRQEFFLHSLRYWWMGLAFVTDTREHCLLEPPEGEPDATHSCDSANQGKRVPHPLAGVSPEAQRLLGRVGSLIYAQRLRCREKSFTSMNKLQKEYEAVQAAQRLEEEALSLELPKADDFVDIGDIDTPIQDLINTAEVYRLAALVLLYRAFPDLLNARLRLDNDGPDADQSAHERRLMWVKGLAIHALGILCQNAPRSGTRSIEQILLVVVAGELRTSSRPQTFCVTEETNEPSLGPSLAGFGPPSPPAISALDRFPARHGRSDRDSIQGVRNTLCDPSRSDCTAEARRTALKRLESIHEILPYRSLKLVQDLVLKTWEIGDNENPDVFWMDVMIDNEWRFLLV